MKLKNNITQKELKKYLYYKQKTGLFYRKICLPGYSKDSVAGFTTTNGYIAVKINGESYQAHRLVWLYVHGYFPEYFIDHIDRNRLNNKISNLRVVSTKCNMRNSGMRKDNTTGVKGVHFHKTHQKFTANIVIDQKLIHLGLLNFKIQAAYARYDAEVKYEWNKCATDSSAYNYIQEFRKQYGNRTKFHKKYIGKI